MADGIWAGARDVMIPSGTDNLAGWLLIPEGAGPHPCVVMGHGFSMTRYDGMAPYAAAFAAAGFAVLAFDYRRFGDSGGEPRQQFRASAQREDWRNAVADARADPQVDAARVAVWGFSFGGGLAIETALADEQVCAVVALCPFVDGLARATSTPPALTMWLLPRALADLAGRHNLVPVTAEPGGRAALTKPGEAAGFIASAPPGSPWRNEVTPGVFATVSFFRPVAKARRLRQPIHVARGERDVTTSRRAVGRFAKRAPNAELHDYDADHFSVFEPELAARIAADQVKFLRNQAGFTEEG